MPLRNAWKTYLGNRINKINAGVTIAALTIVLILLPNFLQFIEKRNGFSFDDPILALFNPINLTWFIFGLIYIALIIGIVHLAKRPRLLILALKTYAITVFFRIIAMYLLPFEPPVAMIPLNDPFVQFFGSGEVLTKDLFFSGHTATLFILFLSVETNKIKITFLIGAILVGLFVILQHVHYSIDVFAAPFFAYSSYKIAQAIEIKIRS